MGDSYELQCKVYTDREVHYRIVIISWVGPDNKTIMTDDRIRVINTTNIGTNHTSTLKFSHLSEEDEGVFTCHVTILNYVNSTSIHLDGIISKFCCRYFIM